MAIFKRGRVYWYHFYFNSIHIQESSKQGNPRVARQMEAAHRTSLAKGEVGIREKKPVPTLKEFIENRFSRGQELSSSMRPRKLGPAGTEPICGSSQYSLPSPTRSWTRLPAKTQPALPPTARENVCRYPASTVHCAFSAACSALPCSGE
jgi:hypothetical protein